MEAALVLRDAVVGTQSNGAALAVRADVTRRSDVAAMFDEVSERFGRVDMLTNGAGVNRNAPILQLT